jgi:hypothetical protein
MGMRRRHERRRGFAGPRLPRAHGSSPPESSPAWLPSLREVLDALWRAANIKRLGEGPSWWPVLPIPISVKLWP